MAVASWSAMVLAQPSRSLRRDAATRQAGAAVLALAALTALALALLHHPLIAPHPVSVASSAPVDAALAPASAAGDALMAAPLPADGLGVSAGASPVGLRIGTATFYAGDFQGQTMADGRTFNMNDPTIAASNTWPLGTRLLLRRAAGSPWDATLSRQEQALYRSRSIVVTVSDHGDFDHALDLSRAAFARLGRTDEGVIHVLIEPLGGPSATGAATAH